jgi:hypothetical protein
LSAKFKQVRAGLRNWSKRLSNLNKLIHNSNWVLLLLNGLEEQRPLNPLEANFRVLVKNHLSNLLESKRKYWRQRNTVRWVTLGDENTSFFQAMATHNNIRKHIGSLTTSKNILVTGHEQKAALLWNAFKNRLGLVTTLGSPMI